MALKGDRNVVASDISYFSSAAAAVPGGVMTLTTAGSGSALDQSSAVVAYAASPSGKAPIGLLLEPELVNLDTSKYPLNREKIEARMGGKVHLLTKGWVVTDMVVGTPIAGSGAFLSNSGYLEVGYGPLNTIRHTLGYYQPKVGRFLSTKDEDGYAKVQIDL